MTVFTLPSTKVYTECDASQPATLWQKLTIDMLFSSNLANLGWQIWEKLICKDPTIGYDLFFILCLLNKIPKYLDIVEGRWIFDIFC